MATSKQSQDALSLGPQELPPLLDYRRITEPAVIKALADPVRIRIVRLMERGAHGGARTFTVKQLAAELEEPPTKLYRHVKKLLEVGLIQVAELRLVGGIVEQHYRAAQAKLVISTEAAGDAQDEVVAAATAAIEDFMQRYQVALATGRASLRSEEALARPPYVRPVGTVADCRIPRAKAAEFAERLHALVQEFTDDDTEADESVEANLLTIFYATE